MVAACKAESKPTAVSQVEGRLLRLGLELPPPPRPSANYLPYTTFGESVQVAGVAPTVNSSYAFTGKVGEGLSLQEGYAAARLCALNALSVLQSACRGDLDRIAKVLLLRGFVNAAPGFERIPRVIDGASDLIVAAFGESVGAHARTSIGCAMLPANVAVELDVLVTVNGGVGRPVCQVPQYSWL